MVGKSYVSAFQNFFRIENPLNIKQVMSKKVCGKCKEASSQVKIKQHGVVRETRRSLYLSLISAARLGHYTCVENLLAAGTRVHFKKPIEGGLTPLMAVFSWQELLPAGR